MATPPEGCDASEFPPENQLLKELMHPMVCLFFASHLVDLGKDLKKETASHYCSGFVVEVDARWYWMTAGHILKDIQSEIDNPRVVVKDFSFLDHFGPGDLNKLPLPFDFERAWKHYEYDEEDGIDYGIVELREHDKRLMLANKVPPITKADWEGLGSSTRREHFMLGFATDSVQETISEIPEGAIIRSRTCPSAIYLEMQNETEFDDKKTKYPRLISKLSDNWPEGNIDGMSGGPIYGYDDTKSRFRIVGIQSGWRRISRMTYATPFQLAITRSIEAISNRRT